MSSLLKANWNGQTGRRAGKRAQVSIGMHAHPKMGSGPFQFPEMKFEIFTVLGRSHALLQPGMWSE
jgi:hypothetical protein